MIEGSPRDCLLYEREARTETGTVERMLVVVNFSQRPLNSPCLPALHRAWSWRLRIPMRQIPSGIPPEYGSVLTKVGSYVFLNGRRRV